MRQYDVTNYGMPQMASPAQIERERVAAAARLQAILDRHDASAQAFAKAEAESVEAELKRRFLECPGCTPELWKVNRDRIIAEYAVAMTGQADKFERERLAMQNSSAYNRF